MRLPKYRFLIGKLGDTVFMDGALSYDNDGNLIHNDLTATCELIEIEPDQLIYINIDLTYEEEVENIGYLRHQIKYFDKNKKLILTDELKDYNDRTIKPPKGAVYFAPVMSWLDLYFNDHYSSRFIYLLSECNPHYKSLSKKYSKESGQEFFRESLDGKITLFGDDFRYVHNSGLEDRLVFFVEKYMTDKEYWLMYFKGNFNKTDCKYDVARGRCELNIEPHDNYTDVLDKYDNTYDIIKLKPEIEKITVTKRPLVQVYIAGSDKICCIHSGTYWETDVNESIDEEDKLLKKYYFAKSAQCLEIRLDKMSGLFVGKNGVYEQGSDTGFYIEYTGIVRIEEVTSVYTEYYRYQLKRKSDSLALYQYDKKKTDDNNAPEVGGVFTSISSLATGSYTIGEVFEYNIFTRLLCDVDSFEQAGETVTTYDLPLDDFVSDNRNYKKCIGITDAVDIYITSKTVSTPTRYGQNDYKEYFTNKFLPPSAGVGRLYPVNRTYWVNSSIWLAYNNSYKYFEPLLRKSYILKDSYHIASVIKAMLKEIAPQLTHEATAEYSRFLYDTATPLSMDRFYVYMTQKTNILKGNYDQAAQKAELSFESLMQMLANCFRCYWFIDGNKFRIEHISYFINGGSYQSKDNIQLDFTKLKDQFNGKSAAYFQTELEFDKDELSARYEFNWMDDVTELFGDVTIDVNSNYIKKDKTENITVGSFSSDVDFMLYNPDNFAEDGFALLCPVLNNGRYELPIKSMTLADEDGDEYEAITQNTYATCAYLMRFYTYDFPAVNIKCNVLPKLMANGIRQCMSHSIEFMTEEDIDVYGLIRTIFGDGRVGEYSVNLDTRAAKVTLLYKPE